MGGPGSGGRPSGILKNKGLVGISKVMGFGGKRFSWRKLTKEQAAIGLNKSHGMQRHHWIRLAKIAG